MVKAARKDKSKSKKLGRDFKFAVVSKRHVAAERLARKIAKKLKAGADPRTARNINLPVSTNPNMVVVVGGDGTVLYAESVYKGIPKLVIAYGKVCFLSEVAVEDWKTAINAVLSGNYWLEKRDKLSSNILSDALNEFTVISSIPNKMIDLCVYLNDQKVMKLRGDGVLVCTPTGSTAYALASGGPIIIPGCDVFGIAPIAPFMLRTRPIVFNDDWVVKIIPTGRPATVTVDGGEVRKVDTRTEIIIKKSRKPTWFVRTRDPDFFGKLKRI